MGEGFFLQRAQKLIQIRIITITCIIYNKGNDKMIKHTCTIANKKLNQKIKPKDRPTAVITHCHSTMAPLSKGYFGASHFVPCREVVLFSEVEIYCIYTFGDMRSILCRYVVLFSNVFLLIQLGKYKLCIYTVHIVTVHINSRVIYMYMSCTVLQYYSITSTRVLLYISYIITCFFVITIVTCTCTCN